MPKVGFITVIVQLCDDFSIMVFSFSCYFLRADYPGWSLQSIHLSYCYLHD